MTFGPGLRRFGLAVALLVSGPILPVSSQVPLLSPRYGAPPAPSILTVRLFAEAGPIVAFLDQSSVLASERAAAKGLRDFARREARQQAAFAASLAAQRPQDQQSADPLDTAARAADLIDRGSETVLSGLPPLLRTPGSEAVAIERANTGLGAETLRQMALSSGAAFDSLYVTAQGNGLRHLAALYRLYIQNGDEQALRALVVHELPRVQARLAELRSVGRTR